MKLNLKAAISETKIEKSRHHIMVVDDEPGNLRTLERYLGDTYHVTSFESPQEALEKLASHDSESKFSLIISDHIMPEMTGVEFLTKLDERKHPALRVILTGFAALDNVIAAINSAGVFRFATKPIDGNTIRKLVEEALQMYEMREENLSLITLVKELMESQAYMSKQLATLGHDDMIPALSEKGRKATAPRRLPVAVLFADVRGFTKLSGTQPPETVMDILQQLFKVMHQVIYDTGGLVDKHLGDGLMAIFGLGGTEGNGLALKACAALVETISATITNLPEPFDQIRVSFGLATGDVVVGMLGSESRSELAVIGQPANFAARLQDFSKLALSTAPNQPLGEFNKVMALIDSKLLNGDSNIEKVQLPEKYRVRDFPDEDSLGIIRD
jgi:adenylate cyclase